MAPIKFINKVVFRPEKEGLTKMLGANEQLVLGALWEKGPLPGRRLYEEVSRSRELAYTTVLTIVGRMVKKGSVRRKRVDGLYYYEAAMDKSEFERRASAAVVKGIIDVSPAHALSAFIDSISELDESKLDEIMRIIEERRKADGR
jgi:predicted transcriptional regulator